jgi:hypothetical protein
MKTMFEHEQDDACLLGRTNLRYCADTLAKRTRTAALFPLPVLTVLGEMFPGDGS